MRRSHTLTLVAALLMGLWGCSRSTDRQSQSATDSSVAEDAQTGHGELNGASESETSDMEKMKVALATLSPDDAASAEAQHMCPVSDEMLGLMGPPIKVAVEDREVWICCEGCRSTLMDDPSKFLAKLDGQQ